jgi:hypothetical protein
LDLQKRLVIFAVEKFEAMNDIFHFYVLFEKLLDEDFLFVHPSVDFRSLCGAIGAPRRRLDNYIKSELGMTGDEVISAYRSQWERGLQSKYGKSFRFTPAG